MLPRAAWLLPLLLWAASASAGSRPEDSWRETPTPHFAVKHEGAWLPPGLTMGIERVHSRLRMDLGMFSPWMAKEKINLYVYENREAYLEGSFKPPAWSNGLAIYEAKAVAIPVMKDIRKQLQVMAHETTHLLFDSYWREAGKNAPIWLNEGLAMVQEADSPAKPETSVWYLAMASTDTARFPRLETFFAAKPSDFNGRDDVVSLWYLQAFSVTHFLLRKHSRLQFKGFCGHLRDGKPVAEALWLSYRYRTVPDLEARWRAWLADPSHRRKAEAVASADHPDQDVLKRGQRMFKFFSTGYTVGGSANRLDPKDDPRMSASP